MKRGITVAGTSPGAGAALPVASFKLVLRGYDRVEVDRFVEELSRNRRFWFPRFQIVIRGYDRAQVDEWIAQVSVILPPATA